MRILFNYFAECWGPAQLFHQITRPHAFSAALMSLTGWLRLTLIRSWSMIIVKCNVENHTNYTGGVQRSSSWRRVSISIRCYLYKPTGGRLSKNQSYSLFPIFRSWWLSFPWRENTRSSSWSPIFTTQPRRRPRKDQQCDLSMIQTCTCKHSSCDKR